MKRIKEWIKGHGYASLTITNVILISVLIMVQVSPQAKALAMIARNIVLVALIGAVTVVFVALTVSIIRDFWKLGVKNKTQFSKGPPSGPGKEGVMKNFFKKYSEWLEFDPESAHTRLWLSGTQILLLIMLVFAATVFIIVAEITKWWAVSLVLASPVLVFAFYRFVWLFICETIGDYYAKEKIKRTEKVQKDLAQEMEEAKKMEETAGENKEAPETIGKIAEETGPAKTEFNELPRVSPATVFSVFWNILKTPVAWPVTASFIMSAIAAVLLMHMAPYFDNPSSVSVREPKTVVQAEPVTSTEPTVVQIEPVITPTESTVTQTEPLTSTEPTLTQVEPMTPTESTAIQTEKVLAMEFEEFKKWLADNNQKVEKTRLAEEFRQWQILKDHDKKVIDLGQKVDKLSEPTPNWYFLAGSNKRKAGDAKITSTTLNKSWSDSLGESKSFDLEAGFEPLPKLLPNLYLNLGWSQEKFSRKLAFVVDLAGGIPFVDNSKVDVDVFSLGPQYKLEIFKWLGVNCGAGYTKNRVSAEGGVTCWDSRFSTYGIAQVENQDVNMIGQYIKVGLDFRIGENVNLLLGFRKDSLPKDVMFEKTSAASRWEMDLEGSTVTLSAGVKF